jgi:hypothetical protein
MGTVQGAACCLCAGQLGQGLALAHPLDCLRLNAPEYIHSLVETGLTNIETACASFALPRTNICPPHAWFERVQDPREL